MAAVWKTRVSHIITMARLSASAGPSFTTTSSIKTQSASYVSSALTSTKPAKVYIGPLDLIRCLFIRIQSYERSKLESTYLCIIL